VPEDGKGHLVDGQVDRWIATALEQMLLLTAVREEDLRALAPGAVRQVYGRGNIILQPGRQRIVAFVSGGGREYRSSVDGDELTVAIYQPGEIHGLEYANVTVQSRSTLVATSEQTEVVVLAPIALRGFLASHPDVLLSAFDLNAKGGELATNRLEEVTLYDVTAYVAHELARRAQDSDDDRVAVTHAELAAWIGSSEREVGKGLQRLKDQGLTSSKRYRPGIVVLNRRRLADYRKKDR